MTLVAATYPPVPLLLSPPLPRGCGIGRQKSAGVLLAGPGKPAILSEFETHFAARDR